MTHTTEQHITSLADNIHSWAVEKGFWDQMEEAEYLEGIANIIDQEFQAGNETPFSPLAVPRLREIAESHRVLFLSTKLMLIVSEAAEALEALRDGDTSNRGNFDEELADVVIRVLDTSGYLANNLGQIIIDKMTVNEGRPHRHGRKL